MKIMFCCPGNQFSATFMKCWTDTIQWCYDNDIEWELNQGVSCNLYYVRSMCLKANFLKGKIQNPFNDKPYDYIMWIDSDQVWKPKQIGELIKYDEPIVSGYYMCEGGLQTICGNFDITNYKNTFLYDSISLKKLPKYEYNKQLTEVGYTGFGFMLIKKRVFESIEYPWFEPAFTVHGNIRDFSFEDVGFCNKAKQAGYKILVDTTIKVGHEKKHIY